MKNGDKGQVRHFLIVFDTVTQEVIEQHEFDDGDEAAAAYAEFERAHRGDRKLEIVLVSSDSLETVKRTHGNYFGTPSASPYLAGTR